MSKSKFFLNRPDDSISLSRGKIIVTTLKWLVILLACATLLRIVCVSVYMSQGVNPMELTKFGGDPSNYVGKATWFLFVQLLVVAPLLEEVIFRLGL